MIVIEIKIKSLKFNLKNPKNLIDDTIPLNRNGFLN